MLVVGVVVGVVEEVMAANEAFKKMNKFKETKICSYDYFNTGTSIGIVCVCFYCY
jgi:hypothetical protein